MGKVDANGSRSLWAVEIGDFSECHVRAITAASARWCAASACHNAGYGSSPVELIRRGCTVRAITETEAALFPAHVLDAPVVRRRSK